MKQFVLVWGLMIIIAGCSMQQADSEPSGTETEVRHTASFPEENREVTAPSESDIAFIEEFLQNELSDYAEINRFYYLGDGRQKSLMIEIIPTSDTGWIVPENWTSGEFLALSSDPEWLLEKHGNAESELIYETFSFGVAIYRNPSWGNIQMIAATEY